MRKIKTIGVLIVAICTALTACKKTDSYEATLYDDAAITAFKLATLNRYTTTTSEDGETVTQKTVLDCSAYVFHIDQVNRIIYNTDSLPVGTDASRVLCTITTKNNGVAILEDNEQTPVSYYSSTDSIDFTLYNTDTAASNERTFRVYASDGSGYNRYTIKVNVHQQEGGKFEWEQTDDSWTPAPDPNTMPAGLLLLGSSTTESYALNTTDGLLMVKTTGTGDWNPDSYDTSDGDKLPTHDLALVSYPMNMASETDYVLLAGRRLMDETDADGNAVQVWRTMVWRKIVDYGPYAPAAQWTYMEQADGYSFALPATQDLSLVKYDDGILAIGKPYTTIYQSRDNGITWKLNSTYQMPAGFDTAATKVHVSTDSDNYIWLYCEGTGQVWRGRLNRLGWQYQ